MSVAYLTDARVEFYAVPSESVLGLDHVVKHYVGDGLDTWECEAGCAAAHYGNPNCRHVREARAAAANRQEEPPEGES